MGRALAFDKFQESRESILDAAQRLIARDGIQALTLRGLAEEAGCNRQTPYRFFRSKDAIIVEVFLRCHQVFVDYCERAIVGVEEPREQLVRIREGYLQFGRDEREAYAVVFEMEPPTHDPRVVERMEFARDRLRGIFEAAHARGHVADDPNHLSYLYWSTLHSLVRLQNAAVQTTDLSLDILSEISERLFFKRDN